MMFSNIHLYNRRLQVPFNQFSQPRCLVRISRSTDYTDRDIFILRVFRQEKSVTKKRAVASHTRHSPLSVH